MTEVEEYKRLVVGEALRRKIFIEDPSFNNIFVNRDFSGTLRQLYILKNWKELTKYIDSGSLWLLFKANEFRLNKLTFGKHYGNQTSGLNDFYLYNLYQKNQLFANTYNSSTYAGFSLSFLLITIVVFIIVLFVSYFYSDDGDSSDNYLVRIFSEIEKN